MIDDDLLWWTAALKTARDRILSGQVDFNDHGLVARHASSNDPLRAALRQIGKRRFAKPVTFMLRQNPIQFGK